MKAGLGVYIKDYNGQYKLLKLRGFAPQRALNATDGVHTAGAMATERSKKFEALNLCRHFKCGKPALRST